MQFVYLTLLVGNNNLKLQIMNVKSLTLIISLLLICPLIYLVYSVLGLNLENFIYLWNNLLVGYSFNTLYLVFLTSIFSLILGIIPAWFISTSNFKGKNFFDVVLFLPLAIPSYIIAFTYSDILSYTGPLQSFLRNYYPDIYPYFNQDYLQIEILSILMALVLYPYIYTACRISFSLIGSNYIKIARNLGMSQLKTFFKIIIPISRVSIFSGLFLVIMEVLNEYGAVKYFGVNTFTSGIFRSWYSMEDVDTASILAVCLLIIVSIFFILERYSNSKYNYNYKSNDDVSGNYTLNKSSKSLIYFICLTPFMLGFFIPVIYIIKNTIDTFSKIDLNELSILSLNSFFLAFVSSLIIVIIAILFQFFKKISRSKTIFFLSEIVSLTYALPGAVIALSLILIISAFSNFSGISIVFGSLSVLIYAYVMRYMAVGISPLKSSFEKHPESFDQTGRNLGMTNYKIFSKIHLPINKTSILIAFILCFVDIIKELPITLILRPFNFDTLAVKTYEYAIEEMIAKSSIYSLVIILFGTVLLIFLRKIINKSINVS